MGSKVDSDLLHFHAVVVFFSEISSRVVQDVEVNIIRFDIVFSGVGLKVADQIRV